MWSSDKYYYPPWNEQSTWNFMVGRRFSFWERLFSGAMLVSARGNHNWVRYFVHSIQVLYKCWMSWQKWSKHWRLQRIVKNIRWQRSLEWCVAMDTKVRNTQQTKQQETQHGTWKSPVLKGKSSSKALFLCSMNFHLNFQGCTLNHHQQASSWVVFGGAAPCWKTCSR